MWLARNYLLLDLAPKLLPMRLLIIMGRFIVAREHLCRKFEYSLWAITCICRESFATHLGFVLTGYALHCVIRD